MFDAPGDATLTQRHGGTWAAVCAAYDLLTPLPYNAKRPKVEKTPRQAKPKRVICPHCGMESTPAAIARHALTCFADPANRVRCRALLTDDGVTGITSNEYDARAAERNAPAVTTLRRSFGWATLSIVGTLVPTAAALALGNGAPGGVAVFVYAFAFYVLPHALVAVTIATTLAPRVAEGWQAGHVGEVRSAIDGAMRTTVPLLALAGSGMVALAWPLTRLVAGVGQTSSQGLAPIAHTLAAFGPGLLGYGVAFVMTRVLFALGDVRRASLLMIAGAVVGVVTMSVASAVMAPADRAAALAIGYGASQTVAAVLLTMRVHRLTGSMGGRRAARLTAESLLSAVVASMLMAWIAGQFDNTRPQALAAFLVAGTAGVATFAAMVALLRRGELFGRGTGERRGQPG